MNRCKYFFWLIIFNIISSTLFGQSSSEPRSQVKEYSTVYLKVYYQGNEVVYDVNGLSKSPVITMPDGRSAILFDQNKKSSKNEKGEIKDVASLINYMASFGWILTASNVLSYDAGGEKSNNVILNTNQYFQIITFERPYLK